MEKKPFAKLEVFKGWCFGPGGEGRVLGAWLSVGKILSGHPRSLRDVVSFSSW